MFRWCSGWLESEKGEKSCEVVVVVRSGKREDGVEIWGREEGEMAEGRARDRE